MLKPVFSVCFTILAGAAFAQSTASLTFEVATVKPAVAPQPGQRIAFGKRGGPGTGDPGRITWSGATLKNILSAAWDMKNYQVAGPAWLDTERYDIVAKVPAGATKEQVNVMWRNLVAERFGVVLHHQLKEFQAEELLAAKGGVKLDATTLDASAAESSEPPEPPMGAVMIGRGGPPPGGGPPPFDRKGGPQLNHPGLIMQMTIGPDGPAARMVGKAQSMAQLAEALERQLNQPVVDQTGLTGKYDFTLEFAPDFNNLPFLGPGPPGPPPGSRDTTNAPEPSGLTLVGALQRQLGLRLVATKAKLDTLVIDHAEKTPTAN